MTSRSFTYWQDGQDWVGYLDEFPSYRTQGASFEDLKEHLARLREELTSGDIPCVRRHGALEAT